MSHADRLIRLFLIYNKSSHFFVLRDIFMLFTSKSTINICRAIHPARNNFSH